MIEEKQIKIRVSRHLFDKINEEVKRKNISKKKFLEELIIKYFNANHHSNDVMEIKNNDLRAVNSTLDLLLENQKDINDLVEDLLM